jgi:hypothetical protein
MTLQVWQTSHVSYSGRSKGVLNEMVRMTDDSESARDRRKAERFKMSAPLTVTVGDRKIPAYTRDLSDRGVFFCLSADDSRQISHDIDFIVDLPPEITLSTCCRIQCRGRVLRMEESPTGLTGVAAQILDYSIFRDAMPIA